MSVVWLIVVCSVLELSFQLKIIFASCPSTFLLDHCKFVECQFDSTLFRQLNSLHPQRAKQNFTWCKLQCSVNGLQNSKW